MQFQRKVVLLALANRHGKLRSTRTFVFFGNQISQWRHGSSRPSLSQLPLLGQVPILQRHPLRRFEFAGRDRVLAGPRAGDVDRGIEVRLDRKLTFAIGDSAGRLRDFASCVRWRTPVRLSDISYRPR